MNELSKRAISGLFIILWIFLTILYFSKLFIISIIINLFIILFLEWPKLKKSYQPLFFIYPSIPFFIIIYLQISGYKILNLLTFGSCFLFDSASYVFGKLFGKHKIAPKISPGKTLEGFLCGCLILIITYWTSCTLWTKRPLSSLVIIQNLLIPITVSFLALAGDLFESYLKRKSGLKDFGNILPGHGGLLDRFDSIMFVSIFAFLFRNYLISLFNF